MDGRLHHTAIYLAGPVEFGPTRNDWRPALGAALHRIEPTLRIWSPLNKPSWATLGTNPESQNLEIALDKQALFASAVGASTELELPKGMGRRRELAWWANSEARRLSLRLANQCGIIIARVDRTFTWGTIKELEDAGARGIPVFLWMPEGPLGVFGLPGVITNDQLIPEYVHYTSESLLDKVSEINRGDSTLPERDPERWLFLTYPNLGIPNGNSTPET